MGQTPGGSSGDLELLKQIKELENGLNAALGRFSRAEIPVNAKLSLKFAGYFSAIVTFNGSNTLAYGTFLVQGYGAGSARIHITDLQGSGGARYQIDENEEKVIFSFSNYETPWKYSIFMVQGDRPEELIF